MPNSFSLSALAIAFLILQGAYQPLAAGEEAEGMFNRYQQAIEVTKQCREIGFSDAEYERMGKIINEKINHEVGAKRLSLLLAAKKDAKKLIGSKGCDSSEAGDLMKIYDSELK